ncbi:synaptonemal complex protein 3-like [Plodia interpunctella]|uniref:synaptonemal complex protein 3-like n=1 Tax=Plodia interpunctella TaxID=58824 RepID=UPI00236852C6|nr:synaptonemal complex protein 3-like [Plodia interpunctella]
MAHKKPIRAPKFTEEIGELLNDSQFLKDSPKEKKIFRRKGNPKPDTNDDEEMSALIGKYQVSAKKRKADTHVGTESPEESRQKLLDVMSRQLHTRKIENEKLLDDIADVLQQLEVDYNAMNDNKQKLEHITGSYMKCLQQATTAYKQKLDALKEIHASFKQQCKETEAKHKAETNELADELDKDMIKLQKKVIAETKQTGLEALRRSIFQAMQNGF